MLNFDHITPAADALNEWFWTNKASLNSEAVDIIQPLLGPTKSAVELVCTVAEYVYARSDDFTPDALELAGALSWLCEQFGFYGMAVDNRGSKMASALRRRAGIEAPEGGWIAPEDDPEPDYRFAVYPDPEE